MPEIVAVIPAAGYATRLGALPCSKEILPLDSADKNPALICDALVNAFSRAQAQSAYWIIRNGKYDIPAQLGNGSQYGLPFAYLVTEATAGTPFTLDCAFSFIEEATVLLGFPDIYFSAPDPFSPLLAKLHTENADIALGAIRTERPEKMDIVESDESGRVQNLRIKQPGNGDDYAWLFAAWQPRFSQFMRSFLVGVDSKKMSEIYVGTVIIAAIEAGLKVVAEKFPDAECTDIGTPGDLEKIRRQISNKNSVKF